MDDCFLLPSLPRFPSSLLPTYSLSYLSSFLANTSNQHVTSYTTTSARAICTLISFIPTKLNPIQQHRHQRTDTSVAPAEGCVCGVWMSWGRTSSVSLGLSDGVWRFHIFSFYCVLFLSIYMSTSISSICRTSCMFCWFFNLGLCTAGEVRQLELEPLRCIPNLGKRQNLKGTEDENKQWLVLHLGLILNTHMGENLIRRRPLELKVSGLHQRLLKMVLAVSCPSIGVSNSEWYMIPNLVYLMNVLCWVRPCCPLCIGSFRLKVYSSVWWERWGDNLSSSDDKKKRTNAYVQSEPIKSVLTFWLIYSLSSVTSFPNFWGTLCIHRGLHREYWSWGEFWCMRYIDW